MNRPGLRQISWALAAVVVTACGSRSQLYGPDVGNAGGGGSGPGGSGGTTLPPTSSIGGGGDGGGGAPPLPCQVLDYQSPYASLQGGTGSHQRSPRLAFSSDDGSSVTVGSTWEVVEGPGPVLPIELRHTTLKPWGDFPVGSGLGPTYLADLDAGVSYAIARSSGERFAFLYADFFQPPPGGLRFSADFEPVSGDIPGSFLVDAQAQEALFLTRGPKLFAFGAAFENGNNYEIRMGLLDEDAAGADFGLGCSAEPTVADAAAIGDTFLIARASGTDLMIDGCSGGVMAGSPNRMQVAVVQDGVLTAQTEVVNGKPITDLRLAARSDGAWIVWRTEGGEDLPPTLRIGRIDLLGQLVGQVIESTAQTQAGSVAVTSVQDYLMLGWIEAGGNGPSPQVQVFHPDGSTALGQVTVPAGGVARGRLSLLGSETELSAVLAWSETVSGQEAGDQIRLTRVDCLGQPQ